MRENPKHEYRNPKEIRNSNARMSKTCAKVNSTGLTVSGFRISNIHDSLRLRYLDFEFDERKIRNTNTTRPRPSLGRGWGNSNIEAQGKHEISASLSAQRALGRITNDRNEPCGFEIWSFDVSCFLRISVFGFRISQGANPKAPIWPEPRCLRSPDSCLRFWTADSGLPLFF